MNKACLFLFVGYPGAGKTTVAKLIESLTGATHLWVDHERREMFSRTTHSAAESQQLYDYLNKKTDQLLAEGRSVIFDTNFNYRRDRDYLRAIAEKNGADTRIIWLTTSQDMAKQRATHDDHRRKNRYHEVMSSELFDRLSNHMQLPETDEPYLTLNGDNVTMATVRTLLNQQM